MVGDCRLVRGGKDSSILETSYMPWPPGETATPDVEVSSKKGGRNKRRETRECRRKHKGTQHDSRNSHFPLQISSINIACALLYKSSPYLQIYSTLINHSWVGGELSHSWLSCVGKKCVGKEIKTKSFIQATTTNHPGRFIGWAGITNDRRHEAGWTGACSQGEKNFAMLNLNGNDLTQSWANSLTWVTFLRLSRHPVTCAEAIQRAEEGRDRLFLSSILITRQADSFRTQAFPPVFTEQWSVSSPPSSQT